MCFTANFVIVSLKTFHILVTWQSLSLDIFVCVCTRLCIKSCLSYELTVSLLVAITTLSATGSHKRLDMIQSLVHTHYVCNGYVLGCLSETFSYEGLKAQP
jgi:hypothetical protein